MPTTGWQRPAAVIGLRVAGVTVDDIASTTKTLPDFPGMWTGMLGLAVRV